MAKNKKNKDPIPHNEGEKGVDYYDQVEPMASLPSPPPPIDFSVASTVIPYLDTDLVEAIKANYALYASNPYNKHLNQSFSGFVFRMRIFAETVEGDAFWQRLVRLTTVEEINEHWRSRNIKKGVDFLLELPPILRNAIEDQMRKQGVIHRLEHIYNDLTDFLDRSFIWEDSIQGPDFWNTLRDHNCKEKITTLLITSFKEFSHSSSSLLLDETRSKLEAHFGDATFYDYTSVAPDISKLTEHVDLFQTLHIKKIIHLINNKTFFKQIKIQFEIMDEKFKQVKQELEDRFVFAEDMLGVLWTAFETNENVVLHGPGGHGKSEISIEFFNALGIEPFVQALGAGTTVEQLLGGMDMQLFNTTGKIEYLVEHSFMNHEYVIFEEAFDAPVYVLTQLKDILTSKQLRNGTQIHPISCKMIVINTNHSRTVIADDLSIKALMERFPLELEVKWPSYTEVNYMAMFNKLFGHSTDVRDYNVIAKLCGTLYDEGTTISPRTAVKMAKVYSAVGSLGLKYFADIPKSSIDELTKLEEQARMDNESRVQIDNFTLEVKNYLNLCASTNSPVEILKYQKALTKLKKQMDKLVVTENYFTNKEELITICDQAISICATKAVDSVEEDSDTTQADVK